MFLILISPKAIGHFQLHLETENKQNPKNPVHPIK